MDVPNDAWRIVLVGKTGAGKSSLGNTIFAESMFKAKNSANSETSKCQAETKTVNGRRITLIDTPGLFDTNTPEEGMKKEILKCITECAPGPHAFLIVLKVERYTEQEEAVVEKIFSYFSDEAFKYAVILFTHGDQLDEEQTIEEFVSQSKRLCELVKKCGGRCHVLDNKYWKNNQQDEYRSNKFQKIQLLNTIDDMVMENNGEHYTNDILQLVERKIQEEMKRLVKLFSGRSVVELRELAKNSVVLWLLEIILPLTWICQIYVCGIKLLYYKILKIFLQKEKEKKE